MSCTNNCNQGRACTCTTANSDGTSPHSETRDAVEIALDFVMAGLALGVLTFTVFALLGFLSNWRF